MIRKIAVVLAGLLAAVLLLEAGTRAVGFVFRSVQERGNRIRFEEKTDYRILCLGDSCTANQYPAFLEEQLNKKSKRVKFKVIDRGMVGTDTAIMLQSLEANLDAYKPHMVITMTGINETGYLHQVLPLVYEKSARGIPFLKNFKLYRLYFFLRNAVRHEQENRFARALSASGYVSRQAPNAADPADKALAAAIYDCLARKDWRGAKARCAEALSKDTSSVEVLAAVAHYYLMTAPDDAAKENRRAEEIFRRILALDPSHLLAADSLGKLLAGQGRFREEEEVYEKLIPVNPGYAYFLRGLSFMHQDRLKDAEESFNKVVAGSLVPDGVFGAMAVNYLKQKKHRQAEDCFARAEELRLRYIPEDLRRQYAALHRELEKRNIRHVCMQYPMRSVGPLKEILRPFPEVIFVDNERKFKEAVRREGFEAYFTDDFAGDFGHCADKGKKLMAENVADVVLKYFE